MTILSKTMADLSALYVTTTPYPPFRVLFMQIVPPNLYCLMQAVSDGHLEAWAVSP